MPAQSLATKSHQAHCKARLLAITKPQRPSCNRAAPSYHCLCCVEDCSRQLQCQKPQWWHAHLYSSIVNLKQRKAVEAPLATIDFAIQATFEASLSLLAPSRLKHYAMQYVLQTFPLVLLYCLASPLQRLLGAKLQL